MPRSTKTQFNLWLIAWIIKVIYRPILNASENAGFFYLSKDQSFYVMSLQWLLALFLYIGFPLWVHKVLKQKGKRYGLLIGSLPLIFSLILEWVPLTHLLPGNRLWIYFVQDIGPNMIGVLIVYMLIRKYINYNSSHSLSHRGVDESVH